MEEPSVEAKYLSSLRKLKVAAPENTLGFFFTCSVTRLNRASFSTIGTSKGSLSKGVAHRSRYALTGASWMGLGWVAAFAFATIAASLVILAISSCITTGEA